MKKLGIFILSIFGIGLLFNQCFGYDVVIYGSNNEVLQVYTVEEGTTEITLDGNWSRDGNDYTFNGGFNGTTVSFVDGYGNEKTITTNNDLYINGEYSVGYTGQQELLLTENQCGKYEGYIPTFEITGQIEEVSTSGNIFNNFAENSLKFTLSNIPNYIQYVIMLLILFFILGFIRKFRRK